MNYFTVDVLTPSRVLGKGLPAESLLIPTSAGQINVLPEHTHIVIQLSVGTLSVFGGANDADRHFSISHGVCKVLKDKVIILSNSSEEQHDIDVERAERALKFAQEKLSSGTLVDEELVKFHRKKERAQLRIQLAKNYKSQK